ncbi:hypothetical protein ACFE04_030319 [Oxalis oulophora]
MEGTSNAPNETARKAKGKAKAKGKKKIEKKRIEKYSFRMSTFSKRKLGIFKKCTEIVTQTGSEVLFVAFSEKGKAHSYASPSADAVINRFMNHNNVFDEYPPPLGGSSEGDPNPEIVQGLTQRHNDLRDKLGCEEKLKKSLKEKFNNRVKSSWEEKPISGMSIEEVKDLHKKFVADYEKLLKESEKINAGIFPTNNDNVIFPPSSSGFGGN